jgi:hypothetical protein
MKLVKSRFLSLMCLTLGLITMGGDCQAAVPPVNSPISIVIDPNSPAQVFGASKVEAALRRLNLAPRLVDKSAPIGHDEITVAGIRSAGDAEIKKEGFRIRKVNRNLTVTALDDAGLMYGLLDLAEQIEMNQGLHGVQERITNPRFPFRAVKFNLPYTSYRENESIQANSELCRDLNMWGAFLDMMAENRLNVLTLWSLDPFPYLVKSTNFPKATPYSDAELAEWKTLWSSIFRMAKARGIETYIINWNIIVSKNFREHYGEGNTGLWADGYTSPKIEQYVRETVTQVINEYPDLTGLGITPGEAMQKWDGQQMAGWFERTFFEGIKAAGRPTKFIYRAALHGDHQPHRDAIDRSGIGTPESPIIVELKFNWSHGHSSTTLVKAHGSGTGKQYWENPPPSRHQMAWMIRNEDFFRLRWGEPDFIREHIRVNGQDYVGGYFIGSECYIPAKDIFHQPGHPHVNWKYAFERQWLYYQEWGRLLYDPATPDEVFANAYDQRFSGKVGRRMVEAYKLSTRTTQRIAQFFNFTWDHSFYTEGFIGNKRTFITLEELQNANPIEPSFLSIKEYGDGRRDFGAKVTPLQLAAALERDNQLALTMVQQVATADETLRCEIADVQAWAHLGLYFAQKIRTAVALNQNDKPAALGHITEAQKHWRDLVAVTAAHIQPSHLAITENHFHWKDFQAQVDAEVASIGGR